MMESWSPYLWFCIPRPLILHPLLRLVTIFGFACHFPWSCAICSVLGHYLWLCLSPPLILRSSPNSWSLSLVVLNKHFLWFCAPRLDFCPPTFFFFSFFFFFIFFF